MTSNEYTEGPKPRDFEMDNQCRDSIIAAVVLFGTLSNIILVDYSAQYMRITTKKLFLLVTVAALVCIVAVQNIRNAKRIASLESKLEAREVELAKLILRFHYIALASRKHEIFTVGELQQYVICETLPFLESHTELLVKHQKAIADVADTCREYDSDPAVRARQLLSETVVNKQFVDDQIQRLIAIAEVRTLEYVKMDLQTGTWNDGISQNQDEHAAFIQRLEKAVNKKRNERLD